jgi:DNA-binding response OmpR family regulator
MMPGMTGIELFEVVRSEQPDLENAFLFMCGGALTSEAATFLQEKHDSSLIKPVEPRDLKRRIEELIRQRARA